MTARGKRKRSDGTDSKAGQRATYAELQALLAQNPESLRHALGLPEARLMLPVDGRGPRVLVGVSREEQDKLPLEVTIECRGRYLIIPLERDEKYLPANIF